MPQPIADGSAAPAVPALPAATVERLPGYHRVLSLLAERGTVIVASDDLARLSGVGSAQLRKDLSRLGSFGVRGVGYDVDYLRARIADVLGIAEELPVIIVGVGNLGHALAAHHGFRQRGCRVAALVDADASRWGERVDCDGMMLPIQPLEQLEHIARHVRIAVIATPEPAAQGVCDRLVAAGIRSILTFTSARLDVPAGVEVRHVDLALELQLLGFHERSRGTWSPMAELAPTAQAGGTR